MSSGDILSNFALDTVGVLLSFLRICDVTTLSHTSCAWNELLSLSQPMPKNDNNNKYKTDLHKECVDYFSECIFTTMKNIPKITFLDEIGQHARLYSGTIKGKNTISKNHDNINGNILNSIAGVENWLIVYQHFNDRQLSNVNFENKRSFTRFTFPILVKQLRLLIETNSKKKSKNEASKREQSTDISRIVKNKDNDDHDSYSYSYSYSYNCSLTDIKTDLRYFLKFYDMVDTCVKKYGCKFNQYPKLFESIMIDLSNNDSSKNPNSNMFYETFLKYIKCEFFSFDIKIIKQFNQYLTKMKSKHLMKSMINGENLLTNQSNTSNTKVSCCQNWFYFYYCNILRSTDFETCRWFLDTLNNTKNITDTFPRCILSHPKLIIRNLFGGIIVASMDTLFRHTTNIKIQNDDSDNCGIVSNCNEIFDKSIIVFIDKMINLIDYNGPTGKALAADYWLYFNQFFRVFADIANINKLFKRYFIFNKKLLPILAEFWLQGDSPCIIDVNHDDNNNNNNNNNHDTKNSKDTKEQIQNMLETSVLKNNVKNVQNVKNVKNKSQNTNGTKKNENKTGSTRNEDEIRVKLYNRSMWGNTNRVNIVANFEEIIHVLSILFVSLHSPATMKLVDDCKKKKGELLPLTSVDAKLGQCKLFYQRLLLCSCHTCRVSKHIYDTNILHYVSNIILHWCYKDCTFSKEISMLLIENIESSTIENIRNVFLPIMYKFILINDDFAQFRYKLLFDCFSLKDQEAKSMNSEEQEHNWEDRESIRSQYGVSIDILTIVNVDNSVTFVTTIFKYIFYAMTKSVNFAHFMINLRKREINQRWNESIDKLIKIKGDEVFFKQYCTFLEKHGCVVNVQDDSD